MPRQSLAKCSRHCYEPLTMPASIITLLITCLYTVCTLFAARDHVRIRSFESIASSHTNIAALPIARTDVVPSPIASLQNVPAPDDSIDRLDSVDVLLFSVEPVSSIVVFGVDAKAIHRQTSVNITAADHLVRIGDSLAASFVVGGGERDIVIHNGKRKRIVRGMTSIRAHSKRLAVVARMSIEEYLGGVISAEARASDPREYLVALQVLQRNFIVSHRRRHAPYADVCDNTHCQLFHGRASASKMRSVFADAMRISLAVDSARPCYYSANCGGSSLTPADVWGAVEPGYTAVTCLDCRNSRWHRWSRDIVATPRSIAAITGAPATPFVDDDFKIRVGRALGFETVPSNTIDRIERRGRVIRITGRGFGHRVGLCQDGARELALRGQSASQILRRYFPAVTIVSSADNNAAPHGTN